MNAFRRLITHLSQVTFGSVILCAGWPPPLFATEPSVAPSAEIAAYLDSGEFGTALQLAKQLPTAQEQDTAFAAIASKQAATGNRFAAAVNLGRIQDAPQRQQTANSLRSLHQQVPTTQQDTPANAPSLAPGAQGGAPIADFDTLIDLITSTLSPNSWDEVGGPGTISGYPGGVRVNSRGLLSVKALPVTQGLNDLRKAHQTSSTATANSAVAHSARRASPLRKVSLPRLELALQKQFAQGKDPTAEMLHLAGITRAQYLFVYPETGDIVLAGPADDWLTDDYGRDVSVSAGQPTLMLDDLIIALRNGTLGDGRYGCSITPTRKGLASAQEVAARWAEKPLRPGQRDRWLKELRSAVGEQNIDVYGIDSRSHAARVIVEADYHMKRVGMGLEKGVLGVESYLDILAKSDAEVPAEMAVIRWWFVLSPDHLASNKDFSAFELRGPSVRVESENEKLTAEGDRIHTGTSTAANQQFASTFTANYEKLAAAYPVYGELRNLFDLTLVGAVIAEHRLDDRANWQLSHFAPEEYPLESAPLPKTVDSILNFRETPSKKLLAGVSGGVTVDARPLAQAAKIKQDTYGLLPAAYQGSQSKTTDNTQWWWD